MSTARIDVRWRAQTRGHDGRLWTRDLTDRSPCLTANKAKAIFRAMNADAIRDTRERLGLTQTQFGQLLGVHWVTVSKWERGLLAPDSYKQALLERFRQTALQRNPPSDVGEVLLAAGVVAALVLLLVAASKDK